MFFFGDLGLVCEYIGLYSLYSLRLGSAVEMWGSFSGITGLFGGDTGLFGEKIASF